MSDHLQYKRPQGRMLVCECEKVAAVTHFLDATFDRMTEKLETLQSKLDKFDYRIEKVTD